MVNGVVAAVAYLSFFTALRIGPVSVVSPVVAAYGGLTVVAGGRPPRRDADAAPGARRGGRHGRRDPDRARLRRRRARRRGSSGAGCVFADRRADLLRDPDDRPGRRRSAAPAGCRSSSPRGPRTRRPSGSSWPWSCARPRIAGPLLEPGHRADASRGATAVGRVAIAGGLLDIAGFVAFAIGLEQAPTWIVGLASSFGPVVSGARRRRSSGASGCGRTSGSGWPGSRRASWRSRCPETRGVSPAG